MHFIHISVIFNHKYFVEMKGQCRTPNNKQRTWHVKNLSAEAWIHTTWKGFLWRYEFNMHQNSFWTLEKLKCRVLIPKWQHWRLPPVGCRWWSCSPKWVENVQMFFFSRVTQIIDPPTLKFRVVATISWGNCWAKCKENLSSELSVPMSTSVWWA